MAWLYQRPDSGRWWIGYRHNGVQVLKSTGQCDKKAAEAQLAKAETMLAAQRAGALTAELYQAISGRTLSAATLKVALEDWIQEATASTSGNTVLIYQALADALARHFHVTDLGPLVSDLTREQVQGFLNERRAKVSASTANLRRKCLSVFFRRCKAAGTIRDNPMDGIKTFKAGREEKRIRRPFTVPELSLLYQHAPDDFWRFMVLGGFFTGLRLGDLATMPFGAVDFKSQTINTIARKTGATLHIPIAPPLYAMFKELRAQRKDAEPTDPLWPEQAKRYEEKGSSGFGEQFFNLLVKAGIAKARAKRGTKDQTDRRRVNEVSFHCLRHSYVSTLAALGQNQQIVKALAGHSGDQINDLYTKLPAEVLKPAIALLPDITKQEAPSET